ncbi:MAG: O-antigen ligase family protein [Planctomycetota bacterium]
MSELVEHAGPWILSLRGELVAVLGGCVGLISLWGRAYHAMVFLASGAMLLVVTRPDVADVMFASLMITGVVTGTLEPRRILQPAHITVCVGGFVLAYGISVFLGGADWIAVGNLLAKLTFFCFLRMYLTSLRRMRVFFAGYLLSVTASGLVLATSRGNEALRILYPLADDLRARAFAADPNVLGPLTVPLNLWLIDEIIEPKLWPAPRVLKLLALAFCMFPLVAAMSRGAWLNFGLALCVYTAVTLRRRAARRCLILTGVVVSVAVAAWLGASYAGTSWLLRRFESEPRMFERFQYQRQGLDVSLEHPLGIGPVRSPEVLPKTPHNTFVLVLVENGWLACLATCALIGFLTMRLVRRSARGGHSRLGTYHHCAVSLVLGLVANSLVVDTLYWRAFWMVLGLAWVTGWPAGSRAAVEWSLREPARARTIGAGPAAVQPSPSTARKRPTLAGGTMLPPRPRAGRPLLVPPASERESFSQRQQAPPL